MLTVTSPIISYNIVILIALLNRVLLNMLSYPITTVEFIRHCNNSLGTVTILLSNSITDYLCYGGQSYIRLREV